MYTITNIVEDINRGCLAHNMVEDRFSYRIAFSINEGKKSSKRYIDTAYDDLWKTLENIIRNNLSLTNTVVITQTIVLINGRCVCLQSRSYSFSLEEFFLKIKGEDKDSSRNQRIVYSKYAIR